MAQQQKSNTIVIMILVITMSAHYGGVMAQPSGCSNVINSMSQCVGYVTGNTPTTSSGCCTQFASVMQLQPQCWCRVLNGSATFLGIKINEIPDFDLSRACDVQLSPTSQCNGTETNTTPSSDNRPSDATSTRFATTPIISLLLVAAFAMVF